MGGDPGDGDRHWNRGGDGANPVGHVTGQGVDETATTLELEGKYRLPGHSRVGGDGYAKVEIEPALPAP